MRTDIQQTYHERKQILSPQAVEQGERQCDGLQAGLLMRPEKDEIFCEAEAKTYDTKDEATVFNTYATYKYTGWRKNRAILSHCKYSENSMAELRGN